MKKIIFGIVAISFVSCSSVQRVSDNTYQCKASKLFASCEAKMKSTCPNGYKTESQDWSYGFGGAKDIVYFKCTNKSGS